MQRAVGDVTITMIRESVSPTPLEMMFADSSPEVLEANASWLRPVFVDESGNLNISIHALVVESAGHTIVVDTCVGDRNLPGYDLLNDLESTFLADLDAAGFDPGAVDVVLCTHLHFDHVGWNTILVDGEWVPTFPNARYLFNRTEYEYWDSGAEGAAITFGDAVRPVLDAGLADLVDSDHAVTEEIHLEPSPGHTPGHVSVRISSVGTPISPAIASMLALPATRFSALSRSSTCSATAISRVKSSRNSRSLSLK